MSSEYYVRLRYRAKESGKICYVYVTDHGTKTPEKRKAYAFKNKENAERVAHILGHSPFEGSVIIK